MMLTPFISSNAFVSQRMQALTNDSGLTNEEIGVPDEAITNIGSSADSDLEEAVPREQKLSALSKEHEAWKGKQAEHLRKAHAAATYNLS